MLKTAEQADAMLDIANNGFTTQTETVQRWLEEQEYIVRVVSGRQRWSITPKGLVVMRASGYRSTPNYCRNPDLSRERPDREFSAAKLKGNANADKRFKD